MIVISATQMTALKQHANLAFVTEMTTHLNEFCPQLCRTLSKERLKNIVSEGIVRARQYEFTYRGPIRLFLELMLIFGHGFDEDPQYPWAIKTLQRQDFLNQMFKAGRLEHLARDYIEKVQGVDNRTSFQALQKLEILSKRDDLIFSWIGLKRDVLHIMELIFPSKLDYIGTTAAEDIIQRAKSISDNFFGKEYPRAAAVLAMLKFAFGTRCEDDPFYPWIGTTLRDPRIIHPQARAVRLERKAITWLKAINSSRRKHDII